jgi:hypothetical protein
METFSSYTIKEFSKNKLLEFDSSEMVVEVKFIPEKYKDSVSNCTPQQNSNDRVQQPNQNSGNSAVCILPDIERSGTVSIQIRKKNHRTEL